MGFVVVHVSSGSMTFHQGMIYICYQLRILYFHLNFHLNVTTTTALSTGPNGTPITRNPCTGSTICPLRRQSC